MLLPLSPNTPPISFIETAPMSPRLAFVSFQPRLSPFPHRPFRIPAQITNLSPRSINTLPSRLTKRPCKRHQPTATAEGPSETVLPSNQTPPPRPAWAPPWLPRFFLNLHSRPWLQLGITLPLYILHLFCFATRGYKFQKPVIPNSKNLFKSIGYDSIVGFLVLSFVLAWRKFYMKEDLTLRDSLPWKVPRAGRRRIGQTTLLLVAAYLASGYAAVIVETLLFLLAGSGVPLTTATARAWKVLLSHLAWVYMGIGILRRLKPFFPPEGTWLQWSWRSNWVWWAVGGYYISPLFFNFTDVMNQLILPKGLFEEESVVSKLINPENKDLVAMAVGSIGPCVTAPVFEEVVYRGYLLPALACFLPLKTAMPVSAVLFAVNHLNPTSMLPLSMLGFVWAILYVKSKNLTVTILIHAMWNSRVFLGSLLGLGTFTDFE